MSLPAAPKIAFGGDYNPELWPEDVWDQDYRLFQAAGIDTVTLGVFDWALTQPAPEVTRTDFEGRRHHVGNEYWRGPDHTAFQGITLDYRRFMSDAMLANFRDSAGRHLAGPRGPDPRPDAGPEGRLWSWQAVAHGADAVLRWPTSAPSSSGSAGRYLGRGRRRAWRCCSTGTAGGRSR